MKRRLSLCILLGALTAATAPAGDFKQEALNRINALESKYTGLAGAVPQDAYTWRPAEGVRSVSELFLHVAGANYGLTRFIGTAPPEGMDLRGMQNSTIDKAGGLVRTLERGHREDGSRGGRRAGEDVRRRNHATRRGPEPAGASERAPGPVDRIRTRQQRRSAVDGCAGQLAGDEP